MKNITISVHDNLFRVARRKAAELETSVSGLVRNYFQAMADEDERMGKARARMEQLFAKADAAPKTRIASRTRRDAIYTERKRR